MVWQMFVTALIVVSVYMGLLLIIGHPFVVGAKPESPTIVKKVAEATHESGKDDLATSSGQAAVAEFQKPIFKGPSIVGVTSTVNLANGEQEVSQVWQRLYANTALIQNVDWNKGNLKAYAYYQDFSADMSHARLTVGFDEQDLMLGSSQGSVSLPTGAYEQFFIDLKTGVASDQAWNKAYQQQNLIESHTLNEEGEPVAIDAIVVAR